MQTQNLENQDVLRAIVRAEVASALETLRGDELLDNSQAARVLCGEGPGALGRFYQLRHQYPRLDQLSVGARKLRRWRRSDLVRFLIELKEVAEKAEVGS